MARPRRFGGRSRPRYEVIYNPRNKQHTVQRIWGPGFGERLIVAFFGSRSEANAEKKRRQGHG